MENVPKKMKTGLLNVGQNLPPEFIKRIYSIIATIGTLSLVTSAQYAGHAGRDYVTETDMKYAWMHLARTFLDREHLEREIQETEHEVFDKVDKCIVCDADLPEEYFECDADCGRFYCSETCAEADEDHECDEDDSESLEDDEDETKKIFVRSACTCSQCTDIHTHVDTWEQWQPRDEIESFMKYQLAEGFMTSIGKEQGEE